MFLNTNMSLIRDHIAIPFIFFQVLFFFFFFLDMMHGISLLLVSFSACPFPSGVHTNLNSQLKEPNNCPGQRAQAWKQALSSSTTNHSASFVLISFPSKKESKKTSSQFLWDNARHASLPPSPSPIYNKQAAGPSILSSVFATANF